MQPIQELLNRIRWDPVYGRAAFEVAYYDRLEDRLLRVPFQQLYFDAQDHFGFQLIDNDGVTHSIPYHRVKALYRNGECLWHREIPAGRAGRGETGRRNQRF